MSAEQFAMSKFASRQDRDDAMLAEIERLRADFTALQRAIVGDTGASAILEAGRLRARVRVLEDALRAMLTHMGMDEDEWNKPTFDQARAALEQKP